MVPGRGALDKRGQWIRSRAEDERRNREEKGQRMNRAEAVSTRPELERAKAAVEAGREAKKAEERKEKKAGERKEKKLEKTEEKKKEKKAEKKEEKMKVSGGKVINLGGRDYHVVSIEDIEYYKGRKQEYKSGAMDAFIVFMHKDFLSDLKTLRNDRFIRKASYFALGGVGVTGLVIGGVFLWRGLGM